MFDSSYDEKRVSTIIFCDQCSNMLYPLNSDGRLIYICKKPNCGYKKTIDSRAKFDNLVSKKEFLKEKNPYITGEFALDPTMPREDVQCPKCGYGEAVFMISTDIEDTKIELIYICGDRDCGNYWKKISD